MNGAEDRNLEDKSWQRLDKWLWHARFLRHRADCTRLVQSGSVRINRQPTEKAHARLRLGDVVTLPLRDAVRVIEVLRLAARRGPASEAATLFREIVASAATQSPPADPDPCGSSVSSAYAGPHPPETIRSA